MNELLPCPFCGGDAAVRDIKEPSVSGWIGCQRCRCFMEFVKNGKPQAIAAWNRRADDERLKTALKEIVQLACESVEREKTLARLEAEVMAAIDAVPVVRCRECIYRQKAKANRKGFLICPASGMEITDDDYCSYGEKMETLEKESEVEK